MDRKSTDVAIVTGGASGLGLAVVERFLQQGRHVVIVDISEEKGNAQQQRLEKEGYSVNFLQADVTIQKEAQAVANQVAARWERCAVLVNAAGIIRRTASVDVTEAELGAVLDVNVKGTVYMCQAFHPVLKRAGGGAMVNFASMLAHYGSKNLLSYAASKGGVIQVSKCMAVEWAVDQIRVNTVSPGYIETNLSAGATKDPVFRERILSRTPQRRFGRPEEVAAAVSFLCSEDASFITGVDLPIDGGLLAGDPALFPPASLSV